MNGGGGGGGIKLVELVPEIRSRAFSVPLNVSMIVAFHFDLTDLSVI